MTDNSTIRSKTSLISLLIACTGFVILYSAWGEYLYRWLAAKPFFNGFDPAGGPAMAISCLLLCAIAVCGEFRYFIVRKGRFSVFSSLLVFAVLYVWVDCRFFSDKWEFLRCTLWNLNIAYFNLPAFCSVSAVLFRAVAIVLGRLKPADSDSESSDNDLPITNRKDDLLQRADFAAHLAERIRRYNVSRGSLAVALVSPWGNGKTSFINLIKEHFNPNQDSRHIIIDFSPWSYARGADITRVFFERLIIATNPVDVTLSKHLKQYLAALSALDGSVHDFLANSRIGNDKDLQRLYGLVHEELSKSRKTYVVVIDDIDRLERPEVLEVLKIVRGSAGFPNLKFICAFDKDYITKVLAHESSAITDRYLEKFFQIEYWLPVYDNDRLRALILEYASFLSPDDREHMREYLYNDHHTVFGRNMDPISNGISNIRMARRWVNAIELSYRYLQNEVLITDLADLELIKLTSPAFFEFFRTNWRTFTETDRNHLKLYQPRESGKSREDDFIASLFRQNKKELYESVEFKSLTVQQAEQIKSILSRLLPEYGSGQEKAFSNTVYTERYFFNALRDSEISHVDFREIMNQPFKSILQTISAPKFAIKAKSFAIHLEKHKVSTLDDVEKYIQTVFAAGRLLPGFMIDGMEFMERLYNFRNQKDKINRWLHDAVTANRASEFTLRFYQVILHGCLPKFYQPFFDSEIEYEVAEQLFGYALEDNLPFSDISHFYWSTVRHQYDRANGKRDEIRIHSDRPKQLYREYWERNIAELHTRLYYQPHGVDSDQSYYQLNDVAFTLWGNDLQGLIDVLKPLESDFAIKETIRFISAVLAADDRTKAIQFEFKTRESAQ